MAQRPRPDAPRSRPHPGRRRVEPSVDCGRFPAKAVVGESFPVTATVFREGHDAVGANVVLRGPDGRPGGPVDADGRSWRRAPTGSAREVTPDAVGDWTFAVEAWTDPLGTWRHDAAIKIPAGHRRRAGARARAPCCSSGPPPAAKEADARHLLGTSPRRCATTGRPAEVRLAAAPSPAGAGGRLAATPSARAGDPLGRGPAAGASGSGRCTAPGTSSSRAPRARSSSRAGRRAVRHLRHRRRPAAGRRRDGLRRRLPAADPPDRASSTARGRTTPSTPGPTTRASPWAIGAAEGGHDAIHPDLGTIGGLRRVRRGGRRARAWRSRSTSPCSARPTTRGSPSTRSGSRTAPTARSPTPRTRRRSTRTSTRSTSTTTPTGLYAEVLRIVEHWIDARRADLPGRQPAHQAGGVLGMAARARSASTDPDVLFLAEAFTRPAMMRQLAKVGFHQSYTYFTWRNGEVGARAVPHRAVHDDRRTYMRPELLRQHPGHPARVPAVRRPAGVQDPGGARGDAVADLGRLRRLRAVRARRGAARAARSTSTPRSTSTARGTGPAPRPRAAPRAVPDPAQPDPPRRTRRCTGCATCTFHRDRRATRSSRSPSSDGDDTR